MSFRNDIIGGAAALIRAAIKSPNYAQGAAGWSINKDGTAEFNNLTIRGTFNGTDFILDNSGLFIYSGMPAAGNLVASIAPLAGADSFGNAYVAGEASYVTISGTRFAVQLGQTTINGFNYPGSFIHNMTNPAFADPAYSTTFASPGGCANEMSSGQSLSTSVASGVVCEDNMLSGVVNGLIALVCGQVQLGNSGTAVWDDNGAQLNLPASGGPFIQGETFHSVSLASGLSGRLAVKLLPWNAIMIVLQNVTCSSTATSYTLGSLPSAAYYPANTQHLPVANTGNINARLFIPTSGALQLICASNPTGTTFGLATMYPTN
jgi:hypothetical protein